MGKNDMAEIIQKIDKFRLKGNASFVIREGWLTKGMRNVVEDPEVFLRDNATEVLGVGSAMVKSIRFWLQAAGLTAEPQVGRRRQSLTDIGQIIMENDPYFEDLFSLYIVHSHIARNSTLTTVWYLLFNYFDGVRFSRDNMEENLLTTFKQMTSGDFSVASFRDDCSVALKTYITDRNKQASPEDNMQCPLTALDLFSKSAQFYERTSPSIEKLHPYAVMFVLLSSMNGRTSISLDKLLTEPLNVGRVFHLSAYQLNSYLDMLQANEMLTIQRTAGLNMVYPHEKLNSIDVVQKYYRR